MKIPTNSNLIPAIKTNSNQMTVQKQHIQCISFYLAMQNIATWQPAKFDIPVVANSYSQQFIHVKTFF